MKRVKGYTTLSVMIVPGGLLFRTGSGSIEGGVALQFVPCSKMQADEFVRENCE